MCRAKAISIKSAAARRHALHHCVIRVNSRNDPGHDDSTLNIAIVLIYYIYNNNYYYWLIVTHWARLQLTLTLSVDTGASLSVVTVCSKYISICAARSLVCVICYQNCTILECLITRPWILTDPVILLIAEWCCPQALQQPTAGKPISYKQETRQYLGKNLW